MVEADVPKEALLNTMRYITNHELIWPWFGEAKDSAADELIVKPKALYVDEVIEAADFKTLRTDNVDGGSDPTTTTTAGP